MSPKLLWTLYRLYRWTPPRGVSLTFRLSPWTGTVDVVLCSGRVDTSTQLIPRWRPRRYIPCLAAIAGRLDADDKIARTLDDAADTFDVRVKDIVLAKGARAC